MDTLQTAMANSLREHLKRPDEGGRLLRALYTTEAFCYRILRRRL